MMQNVVKNKKLLNFGKTKVSNERGSYRGGLWHGSRAEKTTNHESRISKFHFPESRKSARKTLLSCECLKIQQNRKEKERLQIANYRPLNL